MKRNEALDVQSRAICQAVLDGSLSDGEARVQIFRIIISSDVHVEAARREMVEYSQEHDDLAAENFRLLWNKVSQAEAGGWDMNKGSVASAIGWARQLLMAPRARKSSLRNIRAQRDKADLVDPLLPESSDYREQAPSGLMQAYHSQCSDLALPGMGDEARDTRFGAAADWMKTKRRNVRETSSNSAKVSALLHAFELPRPLRPLWVDRHLLLGLIEDGDDLGWKSAAVMFALHGGATPELESVHPALLGVWDEYSREQLEQLFLADPIVANTLMDFACMDHARPSRSQIKTFTSQTMKRGKGLGWTPIAQQLIESIIAFEFEAVSAFDTTSQSTKLERQVGHQLARYKLKSILHDAALYPDHDLGASADAVYASMLEIAQPMFNLERLEEESFSGA